MTAPPVIPDAGSVAAPAPPPVLIPGELVDPVFPGVGDFSVVPVPVGVNGLLIGLGGGATTVLGNSVNKYRRLQTG